jgi:hypothetical protein
MILFDKIPHTSQNEAIKYADMNIYITEEKGDGCLTCR